MYAFTYLYKIVQVFVKTHEISMNMFSKLEFEQI